MKVIATIEETIVQSFEVDVSSIENAYDEIRTKYKNCELILENPTLYDAKVAIDTDEEDGDWVSLDV